MIREKSQKKITAITFAVLLVTISFAATFMALSGTADASSGIVVPVTGQTTIYYPGDDGEIQSGLIWPDPRFTDNGDGTVTDNLTGLIWLKDGNCFGRNMWEDSLDIIDTFKINPLD